MTMWPQPRRADVPPRVAKVRRTGLHTRPGRRATRRAPSAAPPMTDTTILRDLISLAAGVLLLAGLLTVSVAAASAPGAHAALAGALLMGAGAGILRAQNPRFPRRSSRRETGAAPRGSGARPPRGPSGAPAARESGSRAGVEAPRRPAGTVGP